MSMDRFATELHYHLIELRNASSIVMTNFTSHQVVSHLDLQISQCALSNNTEFRRSGGRLVDFFCTEESLRNNLEPKRRLLHTLHLDFPHGREYSDLKYDLIPWQALSDSRSIFVGVSAHDNVLIFMLVRLLEEAFEKTDYKLKLLKWMADFRPLESAFIPERFQLSCAKLLYHECVDSEFVTKCFVKFFRLNWFYSTEMLKVAEYLLYHTCLGHFHVRGKIICPTSATDACIRIRNFQIIHSVLKYEDRAYYTEESYYAYKKKVGKYLDYEEMSRPENQMSKLRLYRMLQIIYIFQRLYSIIPPRVFVPADASEALRLVWSSIPDSFVSLQEMKDAYEHVLPPETIRQAHIFYEEAISQTVSFREPRSLSQYCRSAIRKRLCISTPWLPDGIIQLKLPPLLESFLNLEKDNLHPDNFQAP